MTLRERCKFCGTDTIALRISGHYIGNSQKIKIWQCRKCKGLWT